MALPKETQERIKADARDAARGIVDPKSLDSTYYGYIAGATAENERAQKMVEALKIISDLKSFTDKEGFVKQVADNALRQWNAGKETKFEGSVITEPVPGIALGCISPEARELLDTIMEQWEKHYASMKEMHGDAMPETTFYGFAYWLVRWSGLVQPAGKEV